LNWCLQMVQEVIPNLAAPDQKTWLALLELEHNNFRAALVWSISRMNLQSFTGEIPGNQEKGDGTNQSRPIAEMKIALQLSSLLAWFWDLHGYLSEGRRWLAQILSKAREQKAGFIIEITPIMAKALNAAGNLAQKQNDNGGAKTLLEESLALRRQLDDPYELSKTLNNLGIVAFNQGDFEQAEIYYEESLQIKYRLGDKRSIGVSLINLAELIHSKGPQERAISLFEEGLIMLKEAGDTQMVAIGLLNLGATLSEQGNYQRASQLLSDSLKLFSELGDRFNIAETLERLASLARDSFPAQAKVAHLFGAARTLRLAINAPMSENYLQSYEKGVLGVQKQLGAKIWEQYWLVGQQMKLEETIDFALKDADHQNISSPSNSAERSILTKDLTSELIHFPPNQSKPHNLLESLTHREDEVLTLLVTGLTTKEIALKLSLSPLTINAHLRSIYSKLGVTTRSAATRYAIENKLV